MIGDLAVDDGMNGAARHAESSGTATATPLQGGLEYFEPQMVLHEMSSVPSRSRTGPGNNRDFPDGTSSLTSTPGRSTRPSRMGDSYDEDDDNDVGVGLMLARPRTKVKSSTPLPVKNKGANTPSRRQTASALHTPVREPSGSFLDNAGYSSTKLGSIAPSILEEATGFIRHRLAEHTLTAFTEKVALDKAKSFLKQWKYSSELSQLWTHQDRHLQDRSRKRCSLLSFKQWNEMISYRKLQRRLVAFACRKVDRKAIGAAFFGWIQKRTQVEHLGSMYRKIDWRLKREFCAMWRNAAVRWAVQKHRAAELESKQVNNLARHCLKVVREVIAMKKSFLGIAILVSKSQRAQLHPVFRHWLECVEYSVRFERAAATSNWRWGLAEKRHALVEWHRVAGFRKQCGHFVSAAQRKSAIITLRLVISTWSDVTGQAKCEAHLCRLLSAKRIRKMQEAAFAGLHMECARTQRLHRFMERVSYKHIRAFASEMLHGWLQVVFELRMHRRSSRKLVQHYYDAHRLVLAEWQAVARRLQRWRHVVGMFKKRIDAPALVKVFGLWQHHSHAHWICWRKSHTLRARCSRLLQAKHFVRWFDRHRAAANVQIMLSRHNSKLARAVLSEWSEHASALLAWEGWTFQGVEAAAWRRSIRVQGAAFELWYLKVRRRLHVQRSVAAKEDAEQPRLLQQYAERWEQVVVQRRVRRVKVATSLNKRDRATTQRALDALAHVTTVIRSLHQRGRVAARASGGRVVALVFQTWASESLARHHKEQGLWYQAARASTHVTRRVFDAWSELYDLLLQRQRRAHKVETHVVPYWTCTWAVRLWVDKHNRSMAFDRLVARARTDSLRDAMARWDDSARLKTAQVAGLGLIDERVCRRRTRLSLSGWMEFTRFRRHRTAALSHLDLRTTARARHRTFLAWWEAATRERVLLCKLNGCEQASETRHKRDIVERWRLAGQLASNAVHTSKRKSTERVQTSGRRSIAAWASVTATHRTRKRLALRLTQHVQDRAMTAVVWQWRRGAERRLWLSRRHVQLQSFVERGLCARACRRWRAAAAVATETVAGIAMRGMVAALRTQRDVLGQWVHQHLNFQRRAGRLVSERVRRAGQTSVAAMFGLWRFLLRYERRLGARIEDWERRDAARALRAWLARMAELQSQRVRARLFDARSQRRLTLRAWGAWALSSNVQVERRLELLRMHCRGEARRQRVFWGLLVAGVAVLRRDRWLSGRLQQTVARIRTTAAALTLREHSAARALRRRAHERIVLAHRVRVLRQAVSMWEGRLDSRKRTHEVLSQAMSLL